MDVCSILPVRPVEECSLCSGLDAECWWFDCLPLASLAREGAPFGGHGAERPTVPGTGRMRTAGGVRGGPFRPVRDVTPLSLLHALTLTRLNNDVIFVEIRRKT